MSTKIGWIRIPVAHSEQNHWPVTSEFLFFSLPFFFSSSVLILIYFTIVGSSSEIGCDIPRANSVQSLFSKGNICHPSPGFALPVPAHLPEPVLQR